jgi:hypothetical protein
MLAKGFKRGQGRFDHGYVVGAEDDVENLEDAGRNEGKVLAELVEQGGEDAERDLDIAGKGIILAKSTQRKAGKSGIPNPHAPDIGGSLLLQKGADLLYLGLAAGSVEQEIAELAAVGLDVNGPLCGPGIALEHEDLVLGPAFLLQGVHDGPEGGSCLGCKGGRVVALGGRGRSERER